MRGETIGYCVPVATSMASYRLRVGIPAPKIGLTYRIGRGDVCFFFKHQAGDIARAEECLLEGREVVYDVVNNHFDGPLGEHYRRMCDLAGTITVSSETMARRVKAVTGHDATVIDDPWENEEAAPTDGAGVLWFGHAANIDSLLPHLDAVEPYGLTVCSNLPKPGVVPWSQESERRCLAACASVLLTGSNPGASSNRVVKALRAGKFVVTPGGVPAWEQFKEFCWIGDVAEGLAWFNANKEEACTRIMAGQEYSREMFSPAKIGRDWRTLFDSILAAQ